EYGVQYLLRFDLSNGHLPWQPSDLPGAKIVYNSSDIQLYQLPSYKPMAFSSAASSSALPVQFDGSGATINTSSLRGGPVILNLLWKPEYRASANGNQLSVVADDWNRISVEVPPETTQVRIDYRPHWEYGYAVSFIALICGVLIGKWFIASDNLGIGTSAPNADFVLAKGVGS
ncbi:MAG TPA: hypothetical protein VLK33_11595, partial [Terriglobales bacterium]|nr:hypothetical protein [Terriglobales bacterium]